MLPEYSRKIRVAKNKRTEIKKFLQRLKKARPSDLDLQSRILHEKAFEGIDCLKCANCCKTTGPLLLDKDIDKLAESQGMRPSDFTEKFLRIDEDRDYVFKHLGCPFLDMNNYCTVYNDRPNACREYPHTDQRKMINKLEITAKNAEICPAVAEVVEGLMKVYR